MYLLFLLIIPTVFALFACATNKYIFKALETFTCFAIVLIAGLISGSVYLYYLCAAFLFSILGDYFLSYKHKKDSYFIYGIALYFLAHVGYLLYIVMSFEMNLVVFFIALGLLVAVYLTYYFVLLKKQISGAIVVAVLSYLIISCAVLAVALSAFANVWVKIPMVLGIMLIVISDTCIAEKDFRQKDNMGKYILPTYYAAQILLSASFLILNFG